MVNKIINGVSCLTTILLLSSCYSSTFNVGELSSTEPVVEAATAHDAHFLGGLIGSTKREAKDYVGDNKNYRVKQYQSFVDGLLGGITMGIYTPTTTKFYLPYGVAVPQNQKTPGLPVKLGIRGGLNLSTMSDGGDDVSSKLGFNAGIILDVPISHTLYFQPGLYFSQKGYKIEGSYAGHDYSEKINLSYLEMPLLVSYHYNVLDDVQLQPFAGPFIGITVSKDDDMTLGSSHESFDAGIQFGIGATYLSHYYVSLGYEMGFVENGTRNLFVNIGYNF